MSTPRQLTVNHNMPNARNTYSRIKEYVSRQRLATQLPAQMYLDNVKILLTASKSYGLICKTQRTDTRARVTSLTPYYIERSVSHLQYVHFVFDLTWWLQILRELVQEGFVAQSFQWWYETSSEAHFTQTQINVKHPKLTFYMCFRGVIRMTSVNPEQGQMLLQHTL